MNKLYPLLAVLLVVVVSGCVGQGSSGASGGSVVITQFEPSEAAVDGNAKVTLDFGVKNVGDSKATTVRVELLNLDVANPQAPGSNQNTETQWGLISGETPHVISDLSSAKPGTEVIVKPYAWKLQAPKLSSGITLSYPVKARVSFDYSTNSERLVKIVTAEELQTLRNKGESVPVRTSVASTGPIAIDIKVKEPVKIEDSTETFTMVMQLSNNGGGVVYSKGMLNNPNRRNIARIRAVLPPGLTNADVTDPDCVAAFGSGADIELLKGQTATLACEISTTKPAASVDKTVSVSAEYGYYVEKSAVISVTGKAKYV